MMQPKIKPSELSQGGLNQILVIRLENLEFEL
jgi:hypothetical protein